MLVIEARARPEVPVLVWRQVSLSVSVQQTVTETSVSIVSLFHFIFHHRFKV